MTERITDRPRPLPELVSEHSGELSRANIGTGRVTRPSAGPTLEQRVWPATLLRRHNPVQHLSVATAQARGAGGRSHFR
jgi:hypothetical protein